MTTFNHGYENEDGTWNDVATEYDTVSDLIEELQENAVDLPAMDNEDDLGVYDAYAKLVNDPSDWTSWRIWS